MNTVIGRDLYLRFNDGPVRQFRVWDAALFIAAREHEGKTAKDEEDRFTVSSATREEYLAEHAKV